MSPQGQDEEKEKRKIGEKEAVCGVERLFGFSVVDGTIIQSRFHVSFCHASELRGIPLNSNSCIASKCLHLCYNKYSGQKTFKLSLYLLSYSLPLLIFHLMKHPQHNKTIFITGMHFSHCWFSWGHIATMATIAL